MDERVVIVGAGHAGGQAALTLRQLGYQGEIVLIGDEPHPPYERPPLSKAVLLGQAEPERTFLRQRDYYAENRIELRTHTRAEAIDRAARTLALSDGSTLGYHRLVLATGSKVRKLAVPGAELPGIQYLRTLDDVLAIRAGLTEGTKLVVVGAGYIGLEAAAVARKLGADVTVVEFADRPLARVMDPVFSAVVADWHRGNGATLRFGVGVTGFTGSQRVETVQLSDGTSLPADMVVVGIGIVPDTALAEAAGLDVGDGITVDRHGRTSDPAIWAAGDVTHHPNSALGRHIRLESVHNAMAQARVAAAGIMGTDSPYDEVPWFWSDQGALKIQMAGLAEPGDEAVLRGAPDPAGFSIAYLRQGKLVALHALNRPGDFAAARQLIARGAEPDRVRMADATLPLKQAAAG